MKGRVIILVIWYSLLAGMMALGVFGLSERGKPVAAPSRVTAIAELGATAPTPSVPRSERPRLYIPRLNLHTYVRNPRNLDLGPAWWPVTGRPGGGDTVAIAGHRITHTHPFFYLDRLGKGDAIYVSYRGQDFRYVVSRVEVRSATDMHIADATGRERLLLSACTPRGSARFRIVITASLRSVS